MEYFPKSNPPEGSLNDGTQNRKPDSLYEKALRFGRIGLAGLGMFISTFETDAAAESLKFQERELELTGHVDTSRYSYESLPPMTKIDKLASNPYIFSQSEKAELDELETAAKERKLNLDTDKMTETEIDAWYEKVLMDINMVRKNRSELERMHFMTSNDPRIMPIVEKMKIMMDIQKMPKTKFNLYISEIGRDVITNSAETDRFGDMYMSSHHILAAIDPSNKDHTAGILTLMNELTHFLRHHQYSTREHTETNTDEYQQAYEEAAKQGRTPDGYIHEANISSDLVLLFKEWLKKLYYIDLESKDPETHRDSCKKIIVTYQEEIKAIEEKYKEEKNTDVKQKYEAELKSIREKIDSFEKAIEESVARQARDQARFFMEMESFVVPVLVLENIKSNGLHFQIPEGIELKGVNKSPKE